MKAIKILIACIVILLFAKQPTLAVSVSISGYPVSITNEPFNLTASISGASSDTNYLKIEVYKEGTLNYFGETYNNSDWYAGLVYSQYLPITIQNEGIWSGVVQGRIGSPSVTNYDGAGTYKIRIRRYTSKGDYTLSEANSSAVSVLINIPTAIITNAPTPTPKPASSSTPTPTPTLKPTSINTPTPKPIITPLAASANSTAAKQVLGQRDNLFSIPAKAELNEKDKNIQTFSSFDRKTISTILIFTGVVFMFLCAIVILYPKIDSYIKSKFKADETKDNL